MPGSAAALNWWIRPYDPKTARRSLLALHLDRPHRPQSKTVEAIFDWRKEHDEFAFLFDAVLAFGYIRLLNGGTIPEELSEQFGAIAIGRKEYLRRLEAALQVEATW